MKVSVIIPVYNASEYLLDAVDSCLKLQDVGEILLVEDGSPDDSLQLCLESQKRSSLVRLLRHPNGENLGAAASRNLGIKNATCEWVAFLDADDRYLPNRFTASLDKMSHDPSLDGAYGDVGVIFTDDLTRQWWQSTGQGMVSSVRNDILPEHLAQHLLLTGEHFHTNGITVKRSFFEKCGLFNEDLRMCQDTDLWLKMAMVGRLAHCGDKQLISERRIHNQNRIFTNRGLHHTKWGVMMYLQLRTWAVKRNICNKLIYLLDDQLLVFRIKVAYLSCEAKSRHAWRLQVLHALLVSLYTTISSVTHRIWWKSLADAIGIHSLWNRFDFCVGICFLIPLKNAEKVRYNQDKTRLLYNLRECYPPDQPPVFIGKLPEIICDGKIIFGGGIVFNSFRGHQRIRVMTGGLLKIGNNGYLNDSVTICAKRLIAIGNNTLIGDNVYIYDFNFHKTTPDDNGEPTEVKIGNNVWIANGSIILPGSEICDHSVIAAGSVVTGHIPAKSIAAGVPARVISRFECDSHWIREPKYR